MHNSRWIVCFRSTIDVLHACLWGQEAYGGPWTYLKFHSFEFCTFLCTFWVSIFPRLYPLSFGWSL